MMKLVFDEDKINIVLMMVNQLRVEGVQQAGLLVNINNLLTNGEKVEENKTENKDKKEEK
ncbi:hypothetical protein GPL19_05880 [Enterocloster bolteae]|nr:hypothetical protein [Enterocloster bolteae]